MSKLTVLKKGDHIVRADPDRQADVIETCKANGYVVEGEDLTETDEAPDWLNLPWPKLRAAVGRLDGVETSPKNKNEALAILREKELIPAE